MSQRYISDRFLPDKAIDLIDEASAKLRMEINSKPEELECFRQKTYADGDRAGGDFQRGQPD